MQRNPKQIDSRLDRRASFSLTAIFILCINVFFFHKYGPVMALLLFVIAYAYFFILLRGIEKKTVLPSIVGFAVFLMLTCIARIWTSNQLVSSVLFVSSGVSLTLIIYVLGMNQTIRSLWELYVAPLRTFGGYMRGIWNSVFSLFSAPALSYQKGAYFWHVPRRIFKGLLIAVPVIALLLSMLEGADPIFAYHIKRLFSWNIFWEIPARLWWSLLLFIVLNPFRFFHLKDRVKSPFVCIGRLGWQRELTVVMALVGATVAAFLIIQWPYVFASVPAETDLSTFGIATYSEYVKKGFGELLRVAALLYVISWVGLLTSRDNAKKTLGVLPLVQWVVMGELIMFVVSVFRRIWLYQLHHGWTLVRIYGGVFLLWLTGMIMFLALRHIAKKHWVIGELLMSAVVILWLGFFNVEHFITTTHPPTVNKRVDYVYLSGMSPDGYAAWKMSFDWASNVLLMRGFTEKDRLDALDRRDIAYAGAIVNRLSRQYHRLVRDFGSEEEQYAYVKTLLEYQQPFEGDIELIRTWTRELEEKKRSPSETIQSIGFINRFEYPLPFDSNRSLYDLRPYAKVKTYDRFDYLFVWNYAGAKAYDQMKQDMPLSALLSLHASFRTLTRDIESSPKQDYPSDISFSTPFLDSP